MIAFINEFLSYGLLVIIFAALMICGGFIGVKLRNAKDAKEPKVVEEEKKS
ncbi:MAG: hypothetical protein IKZ65_00045 [Lachnospiraceae bacterium]|nr:hypothetical protein [Lachnospiraceae bacterium]